TRPPARHPFPTRRSSDLWKRGPPAALWKTLFPQARRVVVCPAQPRAQFLHAACLAGALKAPLYVLHGDTGEVKDLQKRLIGWDRSEEHTSELQSRGHLVC